ncbi:MAG TPA: immunoglobulin domain-containing protein, partial [Bryobacteraceae bacterium]|nr:immunoglobulin domain-containing protein [Bryobacteraceae bacterium]
MAGDNVIFHVVASGTAPLSYQWRFSSTNLPSGTTATLVLSNAQSSHAGPYQVVVSNAEGSATSVVAQLVVRALGTSVYLPPPGGWTYRYEGTAMAPSVTAALDGTWNHNNGSDAWAGDLRGPGILPEGGLSVSNGVLTLEDVMASGTGDDNRRLYFTHQLAQDSLTNANTILSDGVTFTFRARLTPPPPGDPLTELTNAPNGFINASDGKGMIGIRQVGSSGMIISFSLNMASEDTNATTLYDFPAAGLHMNNLNGNSRTQFVDPGEEGTVNVFAVNPTEFHEFWITVQDNGLDPGTHRVSVYADGSTAPTIFNVTAGIGADTPITNYLAIGLPSTVQRGAFDLDWVGYKQGVHVPQEGKVPVEIVSQPASQIVNEGQTATFSVSVSGTPPITNQWYRNGVLIPGATGLSYTTGSLLPPDNNAVFTVACQNVTGSVMSDPAVLTVIGDSTPPTLLSAASLNGQSIGICFSERVAAPSAQNLANYTVNNGTVTVTSATLRADGRTVLLQITGLASQIGIVFTVRATNIVDASFAGNSGGGAAQGIVHGLTAADVGIANGTTFTCASNHFQISAGGSGLGGTDDGFQFASMLRTGDFDVRVRLSRLDATNTATHAGLVARVDQTPGSRSLNAFVTPLPGDNAYHATHRATTSGATAPWPGGSDKPGVPLPNAWIRMTRAGDLFAAYHSANGIDWQSYAQITQAFPATMLVGIAGANLSDSVLDELIFIPPPEIITQPTSIVATNGDLVSLSVIAASKADIRYQWRFNGADLLNETNASLILANVNPGQAGTYQVRVANGGGAVLSVPVTLTVRALDYGDALAAYPTLLANNGARHVLVPGIRLGAAADFELNGFPGAAANGDDLNGSDDEDGVTFISPLWVDQTATVEVVASTNGVLNAWIDYGADGSFAQPQDHVFADFGLEPGTNLFSLIVPFDAKGTNTFARFRFSTVGGLGPAGLAPDGEVEDYAVAVIPVSDLSIVAADLPDPVAAISNLTYQITVRNVGPALATGVTVTNRFSVPIDLVSATGTLGACAYNGVINCTIGDLAVGSDATITVVVRPLQAGSLSSTFGIYGNQPDPNTGNNIVLSLTTVELAPSITAPPASLTVTQHNTATFTVTANGTPP